MMQRKWKQFTGAAVAVLGLVVVFQILFNSADEQHVTVDASDDFQEGTLVVSEVGEISIEPDIAYIRLGAQAVDSSADEAQGQVNERINAVREVLKDHGIEDGDIQTASLNVHPYHQQDPYSEGSEEEQYLAQHILEVEYRDIGRLGELIDDVSEAGANRIEQTRFALENSEEAEHTAMQQAIEKTVAKADVMAESADRTRGEVLQITDQEAHVEFPTQYHAQEEAAAMDMDGSATNVEAGEVKITQHVTVVYKLQ